MGISRLNLAVISAKRKQRFKSEQLRLSQEDNTMKYLEDYRACQRISTFVIVKNNECWGKVIVLYPNDGAGLLRVQLTDWTDERKGDAVKQASASGYGYDKVQAAMSQLEFAGRKIYDHSEIMENGERSPYRDWRDQLESMGYKTFGVLA